MKTTTLAKRAILRASAASVVLGIAAFSAPAFAQDAADEASDETIVVTGSRIARPDLEASSPVTSVNAEALKISGTVAAEEFLRDLPVAVAAIGANTNNGNPGVATIDLRNLGEERTLVLVDGKRFVPYDSNGIVDLNMIPASLIERVDVLTGGASSVYGSDAVAGVVNFIMKSDFEGMEFDAQGGITEKGDGFTRAMSATMGVNTGDGKGNIVANVSWTKADAVYQGARAFSERVLAAANLGPGGNSSTNAAGTVRGIPGAACAAGQPAGVCSFDTNGNLVPYNAARDGFNFNPFNLLQAPQNKWTATVIGRYELSDAVEFFGRASFANSRVTTIIAPSGTFNFPFDIRIGDDPATAAVEAANPNLTAQAIGVLAAADADGDGLVTVPFGRRTVELGTRDSIYENTAYQVVGGFKGDISDSWRWETFAQWGRTSRTQTFANDVAFQAAQDCVTSGVCNLFGPGKLSLAGGNQIRVDLQQYDTTSQFVAGGFVSGDLPFTLATDKKGGLVAGVEFRKENSVARPDNNLVTGNSIGFGSSSPINARLSTKEVYAEVNIPVLDMLSVEGGIRYADYKNRDNLTGFGNSFSTTSWKVGGEFRPIDDVRFRASYQRAVRAPNLNEIGQPFTPSTGDVDNDPCSSDNISPAQYALNGALAALCRATGVPAAAAAAGTVGGPIAGQVNNYVGGNINLTPERSKTLSFGAVLEPGLIKGLSLTVDYFDIKVANAIFAVPEQEIVDACYTTERAANGFFCQKIRRNPLDGSLIGGTETGVDATNINAGALRTQGIDFGLGYKFDVADDMKLGFNVNATHTMKSDFQAAAVPTPTPLRKCAGNLGSICLRPQPKWQWVQTTTLEWGPATIQLRWQHIGKLTKDTVAFGQEPATNFAVPVIGARNYFDLYSTVDVSDMVEVRFGITNLLNKKPPVVGNDYGGTAENSGNTYPATYDPLGRSFFMGATLRF